MISYAIACGAKIMPGGVIAYHPSNFAPKISFDGSNFILHFHFSVDTLLSSKPLDKCRDYPFLSLFNISDSFLNRVARLPLGKKVALPFNKHYFLSLIYA